MQKGNKTMKHPKRKTKSVVKVPSKEEILIAKCKAQREVNECESCCRFNECRLHGHFKKEFDYSVSNLVGAICEDAVNDIILNLPEADYYEGCDNKAIRQKLAIGSVKSFFKNNPLCLDFVDISVFDMICEKVRSNYYGNYPFVPKVPRKKKKPGRKKGQVMFAKKKERKNVN